MDLDDDQLQRLVNAFYARVREDAMLGPLFNSAVGDWPAHLDKLGAFWSSVMLTSGRYKGNPMRAHFQHVRAMRPEMFERWLALWRATAAEQLDEAAAAAVIDKAERIAESIQLGLWFSIDRPRSAA